MAGIRGQALLSPIIFGDDNPNISTDLEQYGEQVFDPMPYLAAVPRDSGIGALGFRNRVPPANRRGLIGDRIVRSPFDDIYFRIYVTPSAIDFGAVTPPQSTTINVWNAWPYTPRLLEDITFTPPTDGIVVSGGLPIGTTFTPLRETTYTLTVTEDVPPKFEVTVTFDFTGDPRTVVVTGTAVVVFPSGPNWINGITETLKWTTTVDRAWSGYENRYSLAEEPRIRYNYQVRVRRDEQQLLDNAIFGWASRLFLFPIWHEYMRLEADVLAGATVLSVNETAYRTIYEGQILVLRNGTTSETVQVLSFTSTTITLTEGIVGAYAAGARVYPGAIGALSEQGRLDFNSGNHFDSAIAVEVSPTDTQVRVAETTPPYTYRGEELYLKETNWINRNPIEQQANGGRVDFGLGPMRVFRRGDFPFRTRTISWMLKSKSAAEDLRNFFIRRDGSAVPVWMGTGVDDMVVSGNIASGSSTMRVRAAGLIDFIGNDNPARGHVLIKFRDGTHLAAKITGTAAVGSEVDVSIDQSFPAAYTPSQVKQVCYLALYRMAVDEVSFVWRTDRIAAVETRMTTAPETDQ